MSFDYVSLAAIARDLIKDFGAPVTLQNYVLPTYDPTTGVAVASYTPITRNAVLLDYGPGQMLAPNTLIQIGDKRLIMEAGYVPAVEDRIIANNVEYTIKSVGELSPANLPVLYDLHLSTG